MVKNVGKNYFKKFFEDKTNPHVVKLFSDEDADSKVSDLLAPNGVPTIYLFKDGDLFEIGYGDNGYDYDYLKESILNEINLKKDGE